MSIIFNPSGTLDIASDPSDLPQSGDQYSVISNAFTRAKNIDITQEGKSKTRKGSVVVGTVIAEAASHIEVVGSDRYTFAGSVIYKNESAITSGLTSGTWSGIQYNAFNDSTDQVFALNGAETKRVENSTVYAWGISAPTAAPVTSAGAAGSLTGAYSIKYTYVRKVGTAVVSESNPSPASNVSNLSSQNLNFTVTTPTDPQVTHIRIYRTASGGATWSYDQELTVGTTSGTSTRADLALGSLISENHDTPPAGTYVSGPNYNGTCFIVKDNLLYYSLAKQPEYWPATYFIEVSTKQFPGQLLVFWNAQPYYITKKDIFFIQGTSHPAFNSVNMKAKTGAQSPQGACPVDFEGIYHIGTDGVYLFASGSDTKITEKSLDPIFQGQTVNGMPAVTNINRSWITYFKNRVYFGYVGAGDYCDNVIVMYPDKRVVYYSYPFEIVSIHVDNKNDRLLAACADGYIRSLEVGIDDSGTDIQWEIQSKDFTLQTRAHFPRWAKYDVELTGTVTASIILDDAVLQTHAITESRNTKQRLIASDNGKRCALRLSGSGVAIVYLAEME